MLSPGQPKAALQDLVDIDRGMAILESRAIDPRIANSRFHQQLGPLRQWVKPPATTGRVNLQRAIGPDPLAISFRDAF